MYSVTDLTELIRYHLVLSTDDCDVADNNVRQLLRNVEQMMSTSQRNESCYWMACAGCGAWVSSELIADDGAGECADGGFRCMECRFADDDA